MDKWRVVCQLNVCKGESEKSGEKAPSTLKAGLGGMGRQKTNKKAEIRTQARVTEDKGAIKGDKGTRKE